MADLYGFSDRAYSKEGHIVAEPQADRRAVCGVELPWIPAHQFVPELIHWACTKALKEGARPAPVPEVEPDGPTEGYCPGCREWVALDAAGLLIDHHIERTKSGFSPCPGSGHGPTEER